MNPDWAELAQGEGGAELRTFSGSGELTGTTRCSARRSSPHTASVSNTEGWVAGGAFLPGDLPAARSTGRRGSSRCTPTCRRLPRVLAATQGPLVPKAAYRALAWGPQDVVLFESRSERAGFQGLVRRVLAWDVNEGRLYQVADVDRASSRPGEFSGTYAL